MKFTSKYHFNEKIYIMKSIKIIAINGTIIALILAFNRYIMSFNKLLLWIKAIWLLPLVQQNRVIILLLIGLLGVGIYLFFAKTQIGHKIKSSWLYVCIIILVGIVLLQTDLLGFSKLRTNQIVSNTDTMQINNENKPVNEFIPDTVVFAGRSIEVPKFDSILPLNFDIPSGSVYGIEHKAGFMDIDLYYLNTPEKIKLYEELKNMSPKDQLYYANKFIRL